MQGGDLNDLDEAPDAVPKTTAAAACNAAHVAQALRRHPYPLYE